MSMHITIVGVTYDEKGELDNALKDYTEAIKRNPDYASAFGAPFMVEKVNAITDFDKAIELKPDYDNAYNNRGTVYDIKGEL